MTMRPQRAGAAWLRVLAFVGAGHAVLGGAAAPPRAAAGAATRPGAAEVVERFHGALLEAARIGREDGFSARYRLMREHVDRAFDMRAIARITLARHWRELEDEQRRRFVDLLGGYTAATYADRFDRFKGQRFVTEGVRTQRSDIRVVRAVLVPGGDGKKRTFHYQLRRSDDTWAVVNVAVEGVSDLAMKRAQFDDVMERSGFAGLLDRLRSRINEMGEDEG